VFEDNRIARLTLLCSIPLLVFGCGKKTESPGPVAVPAASSGAAAPGEADMGAVLRDLTQALRKYSVEHKQVPKTFSEVVAAGYVQHLPEAPPGKKFEIDPKTMQVVVVKQ
jgi:hypothetical protein